MKKIISKILNFIFYFFKVDEKKILFESGRNLIDENPKALYCYIKENCSQEFKTVWLITKSTNTEILKKGEFAYYHTLKSLYLLATAKYWIRSQSLSNILKKKKNQIYIQTWHGHGALKKMGYDIAGTTKGSPLAHIKEWDYFIASSPLDAKKIISSTGYNKEVVFLGSAATDEILKIASDVNKKNDIKKQLGIQEIDFNKKIVFYAPTFRNADLERKNIKLKISSLSKLENTLVLVRLHPLIKENVDNSIFSGNIINACLYPDSSELLAITDILISDYSSIIFKFALLNKPMIFYPYDLDLYERERGFYLDYKNDLPGPIVYNELELFETISHIDNIQNRYKNSLEEFNKKYNYLNDGHVCERTICKIREGFFNK